MYNVRAIKTGINHPHLACRELNRHYFNKFHGSKYNKKGEKIMNLDWDILIILDACRYDMFADLNTIDGKLQMKTSMGSNTSEFLYGNFENSSNLDTVYTTSSPQFQKHYEKINADFFEVINVWNTHRWDSELGTILPEDMTDVSLTNIDRYPNKRHILHYLQPHYPFIDTELQDIGRKIFEDSSTSSNIWGLKMKKRLDLSKKEIIESYYCNLRLVLDSIERLINLTDGKIVITSDHGNMLGERSYPIPIKEWGHPSGIYTRQLVNVPWLVVDSDGRRKIRAERSGHRYEAIDETLVKDRLSDLGYV